MTATTRRSVWTVSTSGRSRQKRWSPGSASPKSESSKSPGFLSLFTLCINGPMLFCHNSIAYGFEQCRRAGRGRNISLIRIVICRNGSRRIYYWSQHKRGIMSKEYGKAEWIVTTVRIVRSIAAFQWIRAVLAMILFLLSDYAQKEVTKQSSNRWK